MSYKFLSTILGIDANFTGNLGVGTTTPTNRLDVIGTSYFSTDMYVGQNHGIFFNGNGGYAMGLFSSGSDLLFQAGGAEKMRLTSSGNVGIGTTIPVSKLHISGTGTSAWLTIERTDSNTNIIDFTQSGTRLGYIGYISNELLINNVNSSSTVFTTFSLERMRLSAAGNLLIGSSTDAGYKLDVIGSGRVFNSMYVASSAYPGSYYTSLRSDASANGILQFGNNNINYILAGNTFPGGFLVFKVNVSDETLTSGTEAMRITSAANIGIGTTNPVSKLQVDKSSQSYSSTTPSGAVVLSNLSGGDGILDIGVDSTYLGYIQSRNISNTTYYNLLLNPLGGNVGIGTTNPQGNLDIYQPSNPSLFIRDNSSIIRLLPFGGITYFQTAQALSSGSTTDLYFTGMYGTPVNMVIRGNGNVLIGTTTDAGFKLDVNGNGRFNGAVITTSAVTTNQTGGQFAYQGSSVTQVGAWGANSSTRGILSFYLTDSNGTIGNEYARLTDSSYYVIPTTTLNSLSGSGTRMVVADGSGTLSTQSIPTGTVTGSGTTNYVSKWSSSSSLTNSLLYDNGTNVGIGTSSPAYLLDVAGASRSDLHIFRSNQSAPTADAFIFRPTNNTIALGTANTERMRIDAAGNVGIGTNNPTTSLDINGSAGITYSNYLYFGHNTSTIGSWQTRTYANGGYQYYNAYGFIFNNTGYGSLNFMTINGGSGNILINTTVDNGTKLNVNGLTQSNSYIDSSNTRITSPEGGAYTSYGNTTGAIKIKLPVATYNSSTMMYFTVKIYQYYTGLSYELQIGGYNYSGGDWYNVFATNLTDAGNQLRVRWGNDGSSNCVWIGETTDTWYYPQIGVTDIQVGFNYTKDFATGWQVSLVNSFDTVQVQRYAAQVITSNSISSYGITGSGTTNYIPKFTGSTTIGSSIISEGSNLINVAGKISATGLDYSTIAVQSGSAQLKLERTATSAGYMYIGADDSGFKVFDSSFTPRFIVTSGGNVGIGTTSPTAKLDVYRGLQSDTITRANAAAYFWGSDIGLAIGQYASGPYGTWLQSLKYDNNAAFPLSLNPSGGNVGIGTSNPFEKLQITDGDISIRSTTNAGTWGSLRFGTTDGAYANAWAGLESDGQGIGINVANLKFYTSYGSISERMRITPTGNILIGTTTDSGEKLQVNGQGTISGSLTIGMTPSPFWNAKFKDYADGSGIYIGSIQAGGSKYIAGESYYNNSGYWYSDKTTATNINLDGGVMRFYTDSGLTPNTNFIPTERMRITTSGNVGIGASGGFNAVSGTETTLSIANSNIASIYLNSTSTGNKYAIYSSAGGTLQINNITQGTYPFAVANSGNVLINTTTDAGYKLDVNGADARLYSAGQAVYTIERGGSGYATAINYREGFNTYWYSGMLGGSYNYHIYDSNYGINKLSITQGSSWGVGIGTTSPNGQLEVFTSNYQRFSVSYPSTYVTNLGIGGQASIQQDAGNEILSITQNYGGGKITFNAGGGVERMRINSNGNVGIGTASAVGRLTVKEVSTSWELNTDADYVYQLAFNRDTSAYKIFQFRGSAFTFAPYDVEKVRIAGTGNVLIGTSTDAGYKLDVNGTVRFTSGANSVAFFDYYSWAINALKSDLSSGTSLAYLLGKANSNNNSATIIYNHSSDFSSSNYLGLGFYGNDNLLKVYASGNVQANTLAGSGTRMVVADSAGTLSTQAIPSPTTKSFGAFQEDTTQTAASSNTGYGVKFTTPDISGHGISVVADPFGDRTYILMSNGGFYNIQFSLQLQNTDGQIKDVTIWLRKNGNTTSDDIPATAGFVSVPNSHGGTPGTIIAAWNYFVEAAPGDFYQLVWSTSDHTRVSIEYYPAGSPPPSAASAILTVNQVD